MRNPCKVILLIFLASLVLPLGAGAAVSGELVKTATDSSVYLVRDGTKYVFPHEAIYLSWGYPSDYSTVETISEAALNSYEESLPVPFRTGYMFRGTSASLFGKEATAVFIADGGLIRPIFSADVYQTLFNDSDWNLVTWIPDDFLSKFDFELGETVLTDNLHPEGVLLRYSDSPDNIYIIEDSKKRIVSSEAFESSGFDEARVVEVRSDYSYENGTDLDMAEDFWVEPFNEIIALDPDPIPDPEPVDPTVYSSYSQKHITDIEYPEEWNRSNYFNYVDNRHEIFFEKAEADGGFGETFKANVAVVFEGSIENPETMEDYKKVLQRVTFLNEVVYNDLTTLSKGEATVNSLGLTEKIVEFKVEKTTRNIKHKIYDLKSDEEKIYVVMSALEENWSEYETIFNHVYSSFDPITDLGFSNRDDFEVTGWGFVGVDGIPELGSESRPYMDIKNVGDTEIDLSRTVLCKLTVKYPNLTETTQELNLVDGGSIASGNSTRMEFNPIEVEQAGEYNFRFDVNSDQGVDEISYDNNYNDQDGREIIID